MISKFVRWFFRKTTGKNEQELARMWTFEYFMSRNRFMAYWKTLQLGVAQRYKEGWGG